jgi:CheY-like chemotaxis protein
MTGGGPPKRQRPVVLLADDATDSRTMYAEFLAAAGFDVLEAENGEEAVAIVRKERPAAVVMDVSLPSIDGIEATAMLRADPVTKSIIVIALSGHGSATEERAKAAGVDLYIRKPCLPSALGDRLRELLDARR